MGDIYSVNSWIKTEESRKEQKSDLQNSVQLVTFKCTQRFKAEKVLLQREISIREVSAYVTNRSPLTIELLCS